jgi:phytoene synthase
MEEEQKIFKKGSTTYYFSSKFFPKKVRDDVFRLYSFVRVADDYVDDEKPQPKKLLDLEAAYKKNRNDPSYDATAHKWDEIEVRVIKHIVRLQHKFKFEDAWVEAFFAAMKADIEPKKFPTLDASLGYVYGSAEVIGLMMAKVMKLPEEAYEAAKMQGRAMQWINFVRDIEEDNKKGRSYFPQTELKKFGLKDLTKETAQENPEKFKKFIQFQIDRYNKWQAEAAKGIHFIPERLQVPVNTAIDMYNWTARKIAANPMIVFEKKVKPRKRRVLRQILKNSAQGTARVTARTGRQARAFSKKVRPAAKAAVPKVKEAPQLVKDKTKELKDKYIEE